MRKLSLKKRMGIEIKDEFRFVYSFYNRANLMSGPVQIGLCPITKKNQIEPLNAGRLKREKSNFIN